MVYTKIFQRCKQLVRVRLANFHSLEVVDRVSETQLQVGEDWKAFTDNLLLDAGNK